MRSPAASSLRAGWSGIFLLAISTLAAAQDAPAFRFRAAQLRPLAPLPQSTQTIAGPPIPLPALAPVVARPFRLRGGDRELPSFLRRQRLRSLAAFESAEPFTLRTTDGAAILAELSLGFQLQLEASDNVNSAPPGQEISDTVFDFTPIAHLTAGGTPQLQTADSREPELYLDVLAAPTEHQLVHAGQSAFLQHLFVQTGRSTAVALTGVRLTYDENFFAGGSDSAAEETYTTLEAGPVIDYRTSVRTTVHMRANYRRITLEQPGSNRTEGDITAGIECEISPKTIVGTGFEAGRIVFDNDTFGTQEYRQSYVSMAWKATPKVTFRTRTGIEWREFRRLPPQPEIVTVVTGTTLEWRASETTRVAASFSIRNQPSVTQNGSLFRETRYGVLAEQYFGYSYYARCAAECVQRAYDTGSRETDFTLRPAVGYLIRSGAWVDGVKFEIFYEYRRSWNQNAGGGYIRNEGGLQLSVAL